MVLDSLNSTIIITPLIYVANRKYIGESRIHDRICLVDNYYNSSYGVNVYSTESFYLTANDCSINGQEFYKVAEPFISQYNIRRPRKLYDIPGEFTLTMNGQFFLPMLNHDEYNFFNLRESSARLTGSLVIFDFIYYILFGMSHSGDDSDTVGTDLSNIHTLNWIINYINIPGHILPTNYWLLQNAKVTIDGNSDSVATWSLTFISLARKFLSSAESNTFIPSKNMVTAEKEVVMRTMRTRDFYVNILNNVYNVLPIVNLSLNAQINWEKKATNFSYFLDKEDPFLLNRYFSANGVSSTINLGFIGELSHYSYLAGFTSQTKANLPLDIYTAGLSKGFDAIINNLIILPKAFNINIQADSFIKCDTTGSIMGMNNIYDTNESLGMSMVY